MTILKQFAKSLYSPKTIAMFRFQGIGRTIGYIFFITLVVSLPFIVRFSLMTTSGMEALKESVAADLPEFAIKDGELISAANETIAVQARETAIIFDPSGSVHPQDLQNEKQAFGFLRKEFALAVNGQVQTFSYALLHSDSLTKKEITDAADSLPSYLVIFLPAVWALYYLFIAAVEFIKVSIFAGIALLFTQFLKRRLSYRQGFRLAAYALTPSAALLVLLNLAGISFPYSFLADWLITSAVLLAAVQAIPPPAAKRAPLAK
ncbi:DUF1189 domain-containing protein [Bacillus xiapuensis]|uniref:DUF1189 domain-containing protein n=1 Tax=Bacillus xiapuensis TaxID=2014075 RepID=UPI000C239D03|nr:DUF1189 domain-containing protein [Bacillus xiapuensis]